MAQTQFRSQQGQQYIRPQTPIPQTQNLAMQREIQRLQALQQEALKLQAMKKAQGSQIQRQMMIKRQQDVQRKIQQPQVPQKPASNLLPYVNTYAPRLRLGETALMLPPIKRNEPVIPLKRSRFAEDSEEEEIDDFEQFDKHSEPEKESGDGEEEVEDEESSEFQNSAGTPENISGQTSEDRSQQQTAAPSLQQAQPPKTIRTQLNNPINPKRTRMLRSTKHEYDKLF